MPKAKWHTCVKIPILVLLLRWRRRPTIIPTTANIIQKLPGSVVNYFGQSLASVQLANNGVDSSILDPMTTKRRRFTYLCALFYEAVWNLLGHCCYCCCGGGVCLIQIRSEIDRAKVGLNQFGQGLFLGRQDYDGLTRFWMGLLINGSAIDALFKMIDDLDLG